MAALVLADTIDGEVYETRIFYMADPDGVGGGLYEHMAMAGDDFDIAGSQRICDVHRLDMREERGMIILQLTDADGRETPLHIGRRAVQ